MLAGGFQIDLLVRHESQFCIQVLISKVVLTEYSNVSFTFAGTNSFHFMNFPACAPSPCCAHLSCQHAEGAVGADKRRPSYSCFRKRAGEYHHEKKQPREYRECHLPQFKVKFVYLIRNVELSADSAEPLTSTLFLGPVFPFFPHVDCLMGMVVVSRALFRPCCSVEQWAEFNVYSKEQNDHHLSIGTPEILA